MNIFKQIEEQGLDLEDIKDLVEFIDEYVPALKVVLEDTERIKLLTQSRLDMMKQEAFIAFDQISPDDLEIKLIKIEKVLEKNHKRLDLLERVSLRYNHFVKSIT